MRKLLGHISRPLKNGRVPLETAYAKPRSACINWRPIGKPGYGLVAVNGTNVTAHRLIWEAVNGPIPNGLWVLHKCDNKACVRPGHLYLGTSDDNIRDKVVRGRCAPPRRSMKLDARAVKHIRRMLKAGIRQADIAARYSVDPSLISRINTQQYWHPNQSWTKLTKTTKKKETNNSGK